MKLEGLLKTPLARTVTPPVVAPVGTVVVMVVGFQVPIVALTPLNWTIPIVELKLLPEMVTGTAIWPDAGLMDVILGAGTTVKVTPLLPPPPAKVTTIGPVTAPDGTEHWTCVVDHPQLEAATPPKVTVP